MPRFCAHSGLRVAHNWVQIDSFEPRWIEIALSDDSCSNERVTIRVLLGDQRSLGDGSTSRSGASNRGKKRHSLQSLRSGQILIPKDEWVRPFEIGTTLHLLAFGSKIRSHEFLVRFFITGASGPRRAQVCNLTIYWISRIFLMRFRAPHTNPILDMGRVAFLLLLALAGSVCAICTCIPPPLVTPHLKRHRRSHLTR